jgi:hypothetical protein
MKVTITLVLTQKWTEAVMVLMKYFCFFLPVRLGIIITSVMSIIENGIGFIGIFMYSAQDIAKWAEDLRDKTKDNSYDTTSQELYEIFIEYAKECKLN